MVLDAHSDQPVGIITESYIAHAVADGKGMNSVRIYELMTARPTVISTTTSVREPAKVISSGHFPPAGRRRRGSGRNRRHHRRVPRAARTRRFRRARDRGPAFHVKAPNLPARRWAPDAGDGAA
jgi:CBS domain-containing protein